MEHPWLSDKLIAALRGATHIAALTGAGMSAESGIATFRDPETGLWSRFNPDELASPEGFARDPAAVWAWYGERRRAMLAAEPNPGHLALARLEQLAPRFTLITQNIDGLHRRAGSRDPLEIHGTIDRALCTRDGHAFERWDEGAAVPGCPECGAPLRPDVVWFGESLPRELLSRAQEAAFDCDVFLAIGTSGMVAPAASLPISARGLGAALIEINPEPTPLTKHARFAIPAGAAAALPALVAAAWPETA
ncbi:MAG TPA: NAD-dependent deacylase [Herpetosiphonaceae bacterium]